MLDAPDAGVPSAEWPLRTIGLCLALIFIVQSLVLPCMCFTGTVRMNMAGYLDVLFVVRALWAKLRHETTRDWIAYLILLASSVFWVPAMVAH